MLGVKRTPNTQNIIRIFDVRPTHNLIQNLIGYLEKKGILCTAKAKKKKTEKNMKQKDLSSFVTISMY